MSVPVMQCADRPLVLTRTQRHRLFLIGLFGGMSIALSLAAIFWPHST